MGIKYQPKISTNHKILYHNEESVIEFKWLQKTAHFTARQRLQIVNKNIKHLFIQMERNKIVYFYL